jgi:hypothetical protein
MSSVPGTVGAKLLDGGDQVAGAPQHHGVQGKAEGAELVLTSLALALGSALDESAPFETDAVRGPAP